MSRSSLRHLFVALVAGLSWAGSARSQEMYNPGYGCAGGCGPSGCAYRVCKHPNYKPPSYHSWVPFGYYETRWARWPVAYHQPIGAVAPLPVAPPPLAPATPTTPATPQPEAEPIPVPPRPLEPTRVLENDALPILMPAGYPERR